MADRRDADDRRAAARMSLLIDILGKIGETVLLDLLEMLDAIDYHSDD